MIRFVAGTHPYMAHVFGEVQRGVHSGRERAAGILRRARARWRWFDHLGRAYERYEQQHGDRLAASLTFYGFLSFFPITALAFAIVGYVVAISPNARAYVAQAINEILPGLADQLPVNEIAAAKAGASIIALVGLLWAGLSWIGVWRESLRAIWTVDPGGGGNFFVKKLWDVAVLVALGIALVASVAVSSLATSMTDVVLTAAGLSGVAGAKLILRLASIAVAVAFNTLIFLVLFSALSGTRASWRKLTQGALFGAVGFEVLKLIGTYLIGHITRNPVYASFAVMVGLLVWINLVSRFILFAAAWTATRLAIPCADAENPDTMDRAM